jgi:hypothetical protein
VQAACGAASTGVGTIGGTLTIGAWNTVRVFKDNTSSTERRLYLRCNSVESTPVLHDNGVPSLPLLLGAIQSGNSHASMEVADFGLINGDFDATGWATMTKFSEQAYGLSF